jgi:hypothetical protein
MNVHPGFFAREEIEPVVPMAKNRRTHRRIMPFTESPMASPDAKANRDIGRFPPCPRMKTVRLKMTAGKRAVRFTARAWKMTLALILILGPHPDQCLLGLNEFRVILNCHEFARK